MTKGRKKDYLRVCRTCDGLYYTPHRTGRICDSCFNMKMALGNKKAAKTNRALAKKYGNLKLASRL